MWLGGFKYFCGRWGALKSKGLRSTDLNRGDLIIFCCFFPDYRSHCSLLTFTRVGPDFTGAMVTSCGIGAGGLTDCSLVGKGLRKSVEVVVTAGKYYENKNNESQCTAKLESPTKFCILAPWAPSVLSLKSKERGRTTCNKLLGTGEDSSMVRTSPGEAADPWDSWLPGCSGENASPLSSSIGSSRILGYCIWPSTQWTRRT